MNLERRRGATPAGAQGCAFAMAGDAPPRLDRRRAGDLLDQHQGKARQEFQAPWREVHPQRNLRRRPPQPEADEERADKGHAGHAPDLPFLEAFTDEDGGDKQRQQVGDESHADRKQREGPLPVANSGGDVGVRLSDGGAGKEKN